MTIRRALVLSSLTSMILVGCLLLGVQQASALSVGESTSYTALLPLRARQSGNLSDVQYVRRSFN